MKAMQFPFLSPGFHPGFEQPDPRERTSQRPTTGSGRRVLDEALTSTFNGPGVSLATGVVFSGILSAGMWVGLGWAVWSLAN